VLLTPHFALPIEQQTGTIVLPVRFLLKDGDINCTSNSVQFCTAGRQPLLLALRFSQHNNNMFQQADCIHSLVYVVAKSSFNLPPTVVLQQALSVRRARSQGPKTACPKVAMSIIMIPKTLHT
jgi:hypothetical protein